MDICLYCVVILVFMSATRQAPRPLNRYEGTVLTFGAEFATVGVIIPFLQMLSRLGAGSLWLETKNFFLRFGICCGYKFVEARGALSTTKSGASSQQSV